ncbi:TPA: chorismate mutase [Candidatus Acetothermia bacterium]|nr:chorismate mutase [Candidatus Acetothermia bacterium]
MYCRGIRGATSVEENSAAAIVTATRELLERIVALNELRVDDVASVAFTVTPDLDAAYPARAAHEMRWVNTPLSCLQEMAVVGGLPRCIRVLVLWNTDQRPDRIQHVYLRRATALRPDLAKEEMI